MNETEEVYVLITDEGEIVALFHNTEEDGDQLREKGEWTDPTEEQILEWDGLTIVTIELSFIEVFDEAQASGKTLNESAVQEYKTEMS
jgi:hypothetical protein